LKEKNVQVNGTKSSFCAIEAEFVAFEFVAFVLSQQGIKAQVKNVEAIVKIATPKTQSNKSAPSLAWSIITKTISHIIPTYSHHLLHVPRKVPNSSGQMIVNTVLMNSNASCTTNSPHLSRLHYSI
jgi:hypothetical protein